MIRADCAKHDAPNAWHALQQHATGPWSLSAHRVHYEGKQAVDAIKRACLAFEKANETAQWMGKLRVVKATGSGVNHHGPRWHIVEVVIACGSDRKEYGQEHEDGRAMHLGTVRV